MDCLKYHFCGVTGKHCRKAQSCTPPITAKYTNNSIDTVCRFTKSRDHSKSIESRLNAIQNIFTSQWILMWDIGRWFWLRTKRLYVFRKLISQGQRILSP